MKRRHPKGPKATAMEFAERHTDAALRSLGASRESLLAFARLGAAKRIAELDAERTAILEQFPGLEGQLRLERKQAAAAHARAVKATRGRK